MGHTIDSIPGGEPSRATPAEIVGGKSVMVAGGAGFIGSHLCDALLAAGASRVVAVDDLFLGRRENLEDAFAVGGDARFRFEEQDASDIEGMRRLIGDERPEIVFNLAVIPLPTSLERPKFTVDRNVSIASTMCELARDEAYPTLLAFSSSEAYGTARSVPMDETHPLEPRTPYAASKAASDLTVMSCVHSFGIDARILRPFNNFGPRQNDRAYAGIIPIVVRRVEAGEPVVIYGDGEQTRDFIYAADTADAAIRLVGCPAARGRITNIGRGTETSINDLVITLLDVLGVPNHPIEYADDRPGDVRRHCAGIDQARRLIDFAPRTELRRGLEETVAWYRARPLPTSR
ncbi:MAG: dTDP-glucose 4,6-dehydratase [Phycisphaerales bacterium]